MDRGRWQPFAGVGVGGERCPSLPRGRQRPRAGGVCPGPGTGKAFPLSLSAHGKPRAGVGCVPGGPGRPWGCLEPFPLPGVLPSYGLWTQLSPGITHPLPAPLLEVLAQALTPQPLPHSRHWGPPTCPGPPGVCVTPGGGAAGLEGKYEAEGEGSCWEEEPSHRRRAVAPPGSPPLPPCLKHPPDLQGEQPLLLTPPPLSGRPFISPPHPPAPAFDTWAPSRLLGMTGGAPKPSPCPRGLLAMPVPWHSPRCPRAWLRPALRLR